MYFGLFFFLLMINLKILKCKKKKLKKRQMNEKLFLGGLEPHLLPHSADAEIVVNSFEFKTGKMTNKHSCFFSVVQLYMATLQISNRHNIHVCNR